MKIIADENIPFVNECFSSIGQVVAVSGREITPVVIADVDILLVRSITPVDSKLLDHSRVRFVGTATIGCDHIDTEYLSRRNIGFASAPGSNANSAAEYVIAALLEIAQKHQITLQSKSIGVIGVGNVGSRVAKKAAALGMKVKLNDPPLQRQTGDAKYLPIEELYDCDFITLHTPLTFRGIDKTFHLANEKFFERVGCALHTKKKMVGTAHPTSGTILINTSRGGVVDSSALKAAIKTGLLKAVVLDVWENEPNIDTELLEMVNIGTPHIAGYSLDGKVAGMIMIYKAVCQHFGLDAKFDVEDFLPEPAVPELIVNPGDGNEQEVLWRAVRKIYNIREDDRKLRQIINQLPAKRRGFFDNLRKNYSVRREFKNTKIILATEATEGTEKTLKKLLDKLAGIGFKVANEQKK